MYFKQPFKLLYTWHLRISYLPKGQLISKCLFGVFTFFRKTNEHKSTSSKVEFVCLFFGRNIGLKKSFRICLMARSRLPTSLDRY